MAPSKQLRAQRASTRRATTFKKRVILQDDNLDPAPVGSSLTQLSTAPTGISRPLAGQQSLLLSPPRCSTVVDNSKVLHDHQPKVDIASLKDKVPVHPDEVGRLVTVIGQNQHVIRIKAREKQFTIGRHRSADFVIDSPAVSNVHGKVFAHTCDTGDTLVCYEVPYRLSPMTKAGQAYEISTCDASGRIKTRTLYNDAVLLHKDAVILSHGDTLSIHECEFFYIHFAPGASYSEQTADDFWYTFPRDVHEYQITSRTLGSGSYAVVHLALNRKSGRQMACKVIKKSLIEKKDLYDKVELEIRILTQLQHVNILSFFDACKDDEHWYLMLQLCIGGDLHSYVARKERLPGSETLFITYQMLQGLDYLHNTVKAAHRDIKPENVLLRNRGPYPHVLISDFGTISLEMNRPSTSFLGTLDYWAPECFTGSYLPHALDCYSLGCTIYLMIAGVQPFNRWAIDSDEHWLKSSGDDRVEQVLRPDLLARLSTSDIKVAKKILNACPPYQRDIGHVDNDGIALVCGLMAPSPRYRINIRGALVHTWISKHLNELKTLYSRNVRI